MDGMLYCSSSSSNSASDWSDLSDEEIASLSPTSSNESSAADCTLDPRPDEMKTQAWDLLLDSIKNLSVASCDLEDIGTPSSSSISVPPPVPPPPPPPPPPLMETKAVSCRTCGLKTHVCQICYDSLSMEQVVFSCGNHGHSFCRSCLQYFLVQLIDSSVTTRFACPMSHACNLMMTEQTVMSLLENDPVRMERLHRLKSNSQNLSDWLVKCPHPNCGGSMVVSDPTKLLPISCPRCEGNLKFSKKQRLACEKVVNDQSLTLIEKHNKVYMILNTKTCPKCKSVIERDGGCDHMTCSTCKAHFCWQCGKIMKSNILLGSHTDRFSLNGCPEALFPNNRGACYAARGMIFAGKAAAVTIAGPPFAVFVGTPVLMYRGARKLYYRHYRN